LRFGSESTKTLFFLVKLLRDAGYDGPRHFDAHPYRTASGDDVWAFAAGCMRTYLILEDKARQFAADREIQTLLAEIRGDSGTPPPVYSARTANALKDRTFDRHVLASRALPYERLDQLVVDLLLGVR
jgi:xylose isomerase